jgi:hypothetical protein
MSDLIRALKHLSDEAFEKFVKLERRRRRQMASAFREDRDRWSYRRGLSKADQVAVTRRFTHRWDQ